MSIAATGTRVRVCEGARVRREALSPPESAVCEFESLSAGLASGVKKEKNPKIFFFFLIIFFLPSHFFLSAIIIKMLLSVYTLVEMLP
jgi:hypothetical protein